MSAKNWVFTLNNYTADEVEKLAEMYQHGRFQYIVFGYEIGEEGTPHLQGYVQLKKKARMNQVKALISNRAHLEIQRGSVVQAVNYCKKDGDFEEHGTFNTPGGTCICFYRLHVDDLVL